MERRWERFGHGRKGVSYFFCVFFLGKRKEYGVPLVKKTQFLSLLPVSRRFTLSQSWLHNLVAYVVGSRDPRSLSCQEQRVALRNSISETAGRVAADEQRFVLQLLVCEDLLGKIRAHDFILRVHNFIVHGQQLYPSNKVLQNREEVGA